MHFPNFRQLESMDCGPTCLRIISYFYGKNFSLETLREKCQVSRNGVSMLGISEAAESIGFRTSGLKVSWEQLREEVPFPCIVHWNHNHFIVVYKIKKKKGKYSIYVSDPVGGLLIYSEEQFLKSWNQSHDGFVLLLEPTPKFYVTEDEKDRKILQGQQHRCINCY